MKVFLTGGTGLLGQEILKRSLSNWQVLITSRKISRPEWLGDNIRFMNIDIRNESRLKRVIAEFEPDVIIHAASEGDLDFCERNKGACWRVNVEATRSLVEITQPYDPLFIFISTAYVFDGQTPPYDEDAKLNPTSFYGKSKAEAERIVRTKSRRHAILRLQTLYGWHQSHQRQNCATWLIEKLTNGGRLKIVDDIFNNFLWAGDAAEVVLSVMKRGAQGLFHVGGAQSVSRYQFSTELIKVFGLDESDIAPALSEDFPTLVPRPVDTTCSTTKMTIKLGIVPSNIRDGLEAMRNSPSFFTDAPEITEPIAREEQSRSLHSLVN